MQGKLYKRTAISRKPEKLTRLELQNTCSKLDLDAAILRELERFLLELGTDFSFIARQKRMTLGLNIRYPVTYSFDEVIGGGTYAKEMPNIVASGPMMLDQEEVEHQANEYMAIDQLISVSKIYAQDIYELAR